MEKPQTIAELANMVRDTTGPIVPRGAGLHQGIGNPAHPDSTVVDMRALNVVSDYIPSDLTITVGAGMVLGDIQDILAVNRQWLPWDAPQHRHATIGGLLASGLSGPLRHGAGAPRDWLLGMHFVTGDGRIIKSGGKVVKNVAGYDMHKLHIGALGTLGIIAEVSFKLAPLPKPMKVSPLPVCRLLMPIRWRMYCATLRLIHRRCSSKPPPTTSACGHVGKGLPQR
jgi:glycolate oxidase FAD binding subunit